MGRITQRLQPGENTVIITKFRSGSGTPGDPLLRATPSAHPADANRVGPSACS
jgi:hypothetical protein